MSERREVRRRALHEAIQENALEVDGEKALVYGWVLVVESIDPEGNRWLSYLAGTAAGEHAPDWQAEGYLHHALHRWESEESDLPDPDDDEETEP